MHNRTIAALYNTSADAERARGALLTAGLSSEQIHIVSNEQGINASSMSSETHSTGFMSSIKHLFMPASEAHSYSEGVRQGGTFVAVTTDDNEVDTIITLLEQTNPVDLEQSEETWAKSGWTAPSTAATASSAADKIEVMEENIKVGRRDVDRGSVRIRSYVVEQPFSQSVTLREEQVGIERHAVDRPIGTGETFTDRTIELNQMGEEVVVEKSARVKEEISLHKDVQQRSQTVTDKVRHTEVEVEDQRTSLDPTITKVDPTITRR